MVTFSSATKLNKTGSSGGGNTKKQKRKAKKAAKKAQKASLRKQGGGGASSGYATAQVSGGKNTRKLKTKRKLPPPQGNWKDLSGKDKIRYTLRGQGKNSTDSTGKLNWDDGTVKLPKTKIPRSAIKTKNIPRQSTTRIKQKGPLTPVEPDTEVEETETVKPTFSERYKIKQKEKKESYNTSISEKIKEITNEEGVIEDVEVNTGDENFDTVINEKIQNHYHPENNYINESDVPNVELDKAQTPLKGVDVASTIIQSESSGEFDPDLDMISIDEIREDDPELADYIENSFTAKRSEQYKYIEGEEGIEVAEGKIIGFQPSTEEEYTFEATVSRNDYTRPAVGNEEERFLKTKKPVTIKENIGTESTAVVAYPDGTIKFEPLALRDKDFAEVELIIPKETTANIFQKELFFDTYIPNDDLFNADPVSYYPDKNSFDNRENIDIGSKAALDSAIDRFPCEHLLNADLMEGAEKNILPFNNSNFAAYGFYYNERDGRIYADVAFDEGGLPITLDPTIGDKAIGTGPIMNTKGEPAESIAVTKLVSGEKLQTYIDIANYYPGFKYLKDIPNFITDCEKVKQWMKDNASDYNEEFEESASEKLRSLILQANNISAEVDRLLGDIKEDNIQELVNENKEKIQTIEETYAGLVLPLVNDLYALQTDINNAKDLLKKGEVKPQDVNQLIRLYNATRQAFIEVDRDFNKTKLRDLNTQFKDGGRDPFKSKTIIKGKNSIFKMEFDADSIDPTQPALILKEGNGDLTLNEILEQNRELLGDQMLQLLEAKEKQEYANALLDDLSIQLAEQIPLVIKEQNAKNYFNNEKDETVLQDIAIVTNRIKEYIVKIIPGLAEIGLMIIEAMVLLAEEAVDPGGENTVSSTIREVEVAIAKYTDEFIDTLKIKPGLNEADFDLKENIALQKTWMQGSLLIIDVVGDILVTKGIGRLSGLSKLGVKNTNKAIIRSNMKFKDKIKLLTAKNFPVMLPRILVDRVNEVEELANENGVQLKASHRFWLTIGISLIESTLDKIGIDQMLNTSSSGKLIRYMFPRMLRKRPGETMKQATLRIIKELVAKGVLVNTTKGTVFNIADENVQEATAMFIQDIVDGKLEKVGQHTLYDNPDAFTPEWWERIKEITIISAIGIGVTNASINIITTYKTAKQMMNDLSTNENYFKQISKLKNKRIYNINIKFVEKELKQEILEIESRTDIDKKEKKRLIEEATNQANETKQRLDELHEVLQTVDLELNLDDALTQFKLEAEKRELENKLKEGPLPANERQQIQDRLTEIEQELLAIFDKTTQVTEDGVVELKPEAKTKESLQYDEDGKQFKAEMEAKGHIVILADDNAEAEAEANKYNVSMENNPATIFDNPNVKGKKIFIFDKEGHLRDRANPQKIAIDHERDHKIVSELEGVYGPEVTFKLASDIINAIRNGDIIFKSDEDEEAFLNLIERYDETLGGNKQGIADEIIANMGDFLRDKRAKINKNILTRLKDAVVDKVNELTNNLVVIDLNNNTEFQKFMIAFAEGKNIELIGKISKEAETEFDQGLDAVRPRKKKKDEPQKEEVDQRFKTETNPLIAEIAKLVEENKKLAREKPEGWREKNKELSAKIKELKAQVAQAEKNLQNVKDYQASVKVEGKGKDKKVTVIDEVKYRRSGNELTSDFTPLVNKIANENFDPTKKGFTKQQLIDALFEEFSVLLTTYDPDLGVPLFTYIERNLPLRIPAIIDNLLATEVAVSNLVDTDEVNVEQWASTAVEEAAEIDEQVLEETENLRKALGIDENGELYNEVKNAVIESFEGKLPSVKSGKLKKALQNAYAKKLTAKIKRLIKQKGGVEPFLREYGEQVYNLIDQQIFNTTFQEFITEDEKNMSPAAVDYYIKTRQLPPDTPRTSGPSLFSKKPYNEEDFIEYHVNPKKSTTYKKIDQLAAAIAKTLGKDATSDVLREGDVLANYNEANKIQNEIELTIEQIADVLSVDPNQRFNLEKEVVVDMLYEVVNDVMKQGGTREIWESVSEELLPPEVLQIANELGLPEMLDQGVTQFKQKLKDDLKKGKIPKDYIPYVDEYFETITAKKVDESMQQLDDYNQAIAEELDPAVLKAVGGKSFFHYDYTYLDDGEKGGKGSGVFGKWKKQSDEFTKKVNKKSTGEFNEGDLSAVRLINAGVKIIGRVETILNKNISAEKKLKLLEESGLLDELRAANKVNKEVLFYLMRKNAVLLAKDPELTVGFLRSMEATTNNTLSYRALTTTDLLSVADNSQAKWWNKDKNKFLNNPPAKEIENGDWQPNPFHVAYEEALELATESVQKDLTTGKIADNEEDIQRAIDKRTASHLRNKGEHMAAAAPKMEDLAMNVLEAADRIRNGENVDKVLKDLDAKNRKTLRNYGQVVGAEVFSARIDEELGTTSLAEYARALSEAFPTENFIVVDDPSADTDEFIKENIISLEKVEELDEKIEEVKPVNLFKLEESGVILFNLEGDLTNEEVLQKMATLDQALVKARSVKPVKTKKARVFDFDDTIAHTNSKVFYTMPDGKKGVLTAEEFAKKGDDIAEQGGVFDFSDFNRVVEPKQGPLFELMKQLQEADGERDLFILTARAPEAADAIFAWLRSQGIKIKRENIIGLGNSSPQAKSEWFIGKYIEGYNDFYFADDHLPNVDAVADVLSVVDVKSKTQQAKQRFVLEGEDMANRLFEMAAANNKEGLSADALKSISDIKAELKGSKIRDPFIQASSTQNFSGLLYKFLRQGEQGDNDWKTIKDNLIRPYTRGLNELAAYKNALIADFNALLRTLVGDGKPIEDLGAEVPGLGGYTYEDVIRVLAWDKQGIQADGIPPTTMKKIKALGKSNPALDQFSEMLIAITKEDGYDYGGDNWRASSMLADLMRGADTNSRKRFLKEWLDNIEIIFGKDRGNKFDGQLMNAIQATYGSKYREAFEDMLRRMKSGRNRRPSNSRLENRFFDWLNNSVGAVMFFNMRSGLLQTLSSINFINWSFNNPLKAAKAFANQKQYWKDFMKLFNSDFLVDRRGGMKVNVSESEIFDAVNSAKNKPAAFLNLLLRKGFSVTQIADSFAIASGGATYYRNRIKDLMDNQNMSEADAEAQAYEEWTSLSREAQQSSDAMEISSQQAGGLGRVVLAFANTPMQYNRIIWKSVQDIKNGRGDLKTNLSRIAYYSFLQNLLFNALQQAIFTAIGSGELDDEKTLNTLNGMLDSLLRGMGVSGTILAAIKDVGLDLYDRSGKQRPEYYKAVFEALNVAPPIDVKVSKFRRGMDTYEYNRNTPELNEPFNIENPLYKAGALLIASTTNVPADRVLQKVINIKDAFEQDQENWKRIFLLMGWSEWQLMSPEEQKEFKDERQEGRRYERAKDNPALYNKSEQQDILRQHGVSEDEIKKLDTENKRVNAITNLQDSTGNVYTSKIPTVKAVQQQEEENQEAATIQAAKQQTQPNLPKQDTTTKDTTAAPKQVTFTKPHTSFKNNRKPIEERNPQETELYDMDKQSQVDSLIKLNYSKKEIREMKEGDRVQAIIDANK